MYKCIQLKINTWRKWNRCIKSIFTYRVIFNIISKWITHNILISFIKKDLHILGTIELETLISLYLIIVSLLSYINLLLLWSLFFFTIEILFKQKNKDLKLENNSSNLSYFNYRQLFNLEQKYYERKILRKFSHIQIVEVWEVSNVILLWYSWSGTKICLSP